MRTSKARARHRTGKVCHKRWPATASCKAKEEGTVHLASSPCQRRSAPTIVLRTQEGRGTGGRRPGMAGLRDKPRGQPRGLARPGPPGPCRRKNFSRPTKQPPGVEGRSGSRGGNAEATSDATNLHRKPSTTIRCRDTERTNLAALGFVNAPTNSADAGTRTPISDFCVGIAYKLR